MKKKKPQLTITDELFTRNWTKIIGFEKDLQGAISNENIRNKAIGWLFEWAPKPTSETLYDFCIEYCIPRSTLYYWAEADETFKRALDEAKLMIANKLYKGSLHRDYDRDTAFKTIHTLDPEYLKINEYHSTLNSKSSNATNESLMTQLADYMAAFNKERTNGTEDDKSM